MKIREIRAFPIRQEMTGALYAGGDEPEARRAPWTKDSEVASPMSYYSRYRAQRASWRPDSTSVGCLVTADDGSWGFGISRYGGPVISTINDHLGRLLVGENALATGRLWDMMVRMSSPYSAAGLISYAISAIDLALWDLKGRVLGVPVYSLAGGPAHDELVCYATGNDTDWHMELGFAATKLACPYGAADGLSALSRNEELVANRRELVGQDVELMLDCWMSFDVEFAVRLAERLRPYGIRWIEDCLTPENMPAHRALRRRLPWQTLATGEHWYSIHTFAEAAGDGLVDIFQPDIAWAGGFTACQKIAAIAEAAGMELVLHTGANTPYGQHFTYATPNARSCEFFVGSAPGVPLQQATVFPGMSVPSQGRLLPNDEPGFGHGLTLTTIDDLVV